MTLAAKLQLREGETIQVLNASAEAELDLPLAAGPPAPAVLLFVRSRKELEDAGAPFVQAAREDRLAWIAYPKGGQLDTDLNRDTLWEALNAKGIRPVRQVSLDDVWSAMRFRPD